MKGSEMHEAVGWYFVMLPDREGTESITAKLGPGAHPILEHASGRPWIVGRMPGELVTSSTLVGKGDRLAVIGFSSATPETLDRVVDQAAVVEQLDALSFRLSGSFHLLGSFAGRLRAQGSASGFRRVHHAVIDGFVVASDRADVLADLGCFSYDEANLGIRLLRQLPHPLGEQPLWRGVTGVTPGSCLTVDRDGRTAHERRWWEQPAAEMSRSVGAARLLQELTDAMAVRTRSGGVVHCDLSGGLDSTPLCYLAAQGPAEIVAHTGYNDDPGGRNDLTYARIALRVMPDVKHHIYSWDDQPEFFGGLLSTSYRLDEPTQMFLAGPRQEGYVANARSRGARAYITGDGGDHLLHPLPSASHTLFRSNPLSAWRRVRMFQQLEAWPIGDTVRGLLDNRPYGAWLGDQVRTLRQAEFKKTVRSLDWDMRISLPRWLTRDAGEAITGRLRELASTVEPLGPSRALHGQYAMMLDGSRILRGAQQIGAAQQVALESPFFDDRVLEACFSVRLAERPMPTELKPLMKLAMRGLLPAEFLARKGFETGGSQAARGLVNHWDDILELCEDSPLPSTGLVDMQLFRDLCRPTLHRERDATLDATINCAAFMRAQRTFSSKAASAHSAC